MHAHVLPATLQKIDRLVNKKDVEKSSRGKIVESRFEE